MKNIFRSSALKVFTVATFATGLAFAQDSWFLVQSNVGNNHWNKTDSSEPYKFWADANNVYNYSGNEDRYATAMNSADTYYVRGKFGEVPKQLRTQTISSGMDTFAGGTLVLDGTALLLRASGAGTSRAEHIIAQAATFSAAAGDNLYHNLSIGLLEVDGANGPSSVTVSPDKVGRIHNWEIDKLTGNGGLTFSNGSGTSTETTFNLSVKDATAYAGQLRLTSGLLIFTDKFESAGSFAYEGGNVELQNDVSISKLFIDGTEIDAGSYRARDLTKLGMPTTGKGALEVIPAPESYSLIP